MKSYAMTEEWRPVPGYETLYAVSNLGRVRGPRRLLRPERDRHGYLKVRLCGTGDKGHKFSVHRLVAMAWHPNPMGLPEVAHLDHNPLNNTPDNLKWASRTGNHSDSVIENRYAAAGPNISSKRIFTADEVRDIRSRFATGERMTNIATSLHVRLEQIRKIIRRERWAHI